MKFLLMLDKTEFARLVAGATLSAGTTAATISTPSPTAIENNLSPNALHPVLLPQ